MEIQRFIEYSDLYPDGLEGQADVPRLIMGIDRRRLCGITSTMSSRLVGKLFYDENLRKGDLDLLRCFVRRENAPFYEDVIRRFKDLEKRSRQSGYDGKFYACLMSSVMALQRIIFSVPPFRNINAAYVEENFFKALLLINEKVLNIDNEDSCLCNNATSDLQLAELFLSYNYANYDIEKDDFNDIFLRQLVKASVLFSFLFRNRQLKELRKSWMMHYNIRDWTEYVVPHVMALYFSKMKSGILKIEGKSIEQRKSRNLLKRCSIEYDAVIPYNENSDYCKFRARPLIRLSKSEFAITNVVFLIEHLYNSLYFDLKQFRKDSGFRSDDEFRTYWTTEFSQKFMFYSFIRNCLNGDEDSVLDGDECDRIIKARGG